MKKNYIPKLIEPKIQKFWKFNKTFSAKLDLDKPKFYCLTMFPYPSGKLHMGHVRNYTAGDIIARFNRQKGKNVLHPMGWDSFGLPAELAAINHNISPHKWTLKNIKEMKEQLKRLGLSYDWKREISTCNVDYYKWEQWFFLELYKKGIIYRKESYVNWCAQDDTVLSNEQVIQNRCWRCNSPIQIKNLPQWFIRITDYAEDLLNDINILKNWPKKVKEMQRNWIGKTEGFEVNLYFFKKKNNITKSENFNTKKQYTFLPIFTPYLALIMGVTYVTISLDHPLTNILSFKNIYIKNFIKNCFKYNNIYKGYKKDNKKKIGIKTDILLINPISKKLLSLWITNTLALYDPFNQSINWGIPAHYKESFDFAKKYGIKIYPFIKSVNNVKEKFIRNNESDNFNPFSYVLYECEEYNSLTYLEAEKKIFKKLYLSGQCKKITKYKLRDWLISRQRLWGVPIPILLNKKDLSIFKPQKQINLPIKLNSYNKGFLNQKEISNGDNWLPETDTLDTFFQSSWYYARYTCANYTKGMLDIEETNYWLPIDQYIGGIEHAILHLMYFRFFHKLMKEMNLVKCSEPAISLLCQGMVLSNTFCYIDNNKTTHWVSPTRIKKIKDMITNNEIIVDDKGTRLTDMGISKMSKSKNNGVDPNLIIDRYGADSVRLFVMFAAPITMDLIWKESGIKGMFRFLNRVWRLIYLHIKTGTKYIFINTFKKKKNLNKLKKNKLSFNQKSFWNLLVKTVLKVYEDIDLKQSFNTAIACIMNLSNNLNRFIYKTYNDWYIMQKILENFIIILYPFAPHISFFLWEKLTGKNNIDQILWPNIEKIKNKIDDSNVELIVQINNKFKKKICIPFFDISRKEEMERCILGEINIKNYLLPNKIITKIIWIKNSIINILIK